MVNGSSLANPSTYFELAPNATARERHPSDQPSRCGGLLQRFLAVIDEESIAPQISQPDEMKAEDPLVTEFDANGWSKGSRHERLVRHPFRVTLALHALSSERSSHTEQETPIVSKAATRVQRPAQRHESYAATAERAFSTRLKKRTQPQTPVMDKKRHARFELQRGPRADAKPSPCAQFSISWPLNPRGRSMTGCRVFHGC